MRILITAGFDRASHVSALVELALREGHEVAGILVVSPFTVTRLRGMLRQRGRGFLRSAVRRLVGARANPGGAPDSFERFLAEQGIRPHSLRTLAGERGIDYRRVADLNDEEALTFAGECSVDGVIYGGGGILKGRFLDAVDGRVLNAHSGPLPAIRGMNACEWALLLDVPPAVSIHVINRGIDTGGVLEEIPVPLEPGDDVETLRAKCTLLGVQGLLRAIPALSAPLPQADSGAARQRQCFVLAPVLRELLDRRLAAGVPR